MTTWRVHLKDRVINVEADGFRPDDDGLGLLFEASSQPEGGSLPLGTVFVPQTRVLAWFNRDSLIAVIDERSNITLRWSDA